VRLLFFVRRQLPIYLLGVQAGSLFINKAAEKLISSKLHSKGCELSNAETMTKNFEKAKTSLGHQLGVVLLGNAQTKNRGYSHFQLERYVPFLSVTTISCKLFDPSLEVTELFSVAVEAIIKSVQEVQGSYDLKVSTPKSKSS
jgi:hypothetical protein